MQKNLFGVMLASTLALTTLAGCPSPSGATNPGGTAAGSTSAGGTASSGTTPNSGTGSSNTTAGTGTTSPNNPNSVAPVTSDAGTEAASAMSEERTMQDYTTVANEEDPVPAQYSLEADTASTTSASASASASATAASGARADRVKAAIARAAQAKIGANIKAKLKARAEARHTKIKARLDRLADQRVMMRNQLKNVPFVDNKDGTSTKTITIDGSVTTKANKTATRHCTISKTVKTDTKELVSWHAEFKQALPGGFTRESTSDKVLNADDGSYTVTFHSVLTLSGGATRTADWNKTIAADGAITGTGTIVWKDKAGTVKKTSNITLNGDEDAPVAKADDSKATVTAPIDGPVAVTTEDGKATTVEAESVSADATADASGSAITTGAGTGGSSASGGTATTGSGGSSSGTTTGSTSSTGTATTGTATTGTTVTTGTTTTGGTASTGTTASTSVTTKI